MPMSARRVPLHRSGQQAGSLRHGSCRGIQCARAWTVHSCACARMRMGIGMGYADNRMMDLHTAARSTPAILLPVFFGTPAAWLPGFLILVLCSTIRTERYLPILVVDSIQHCNQFTFNVFQLLNSINVITLCCF